MRKRTVRVTIGAFLIFSTIGAITGTFAHRFLTQRYQIEEVEHVRELTGAIRVRLETILARDLLIVHSTAAYISVNPDLTNEEFRAFASAIIRDSATLKNLAAAPDLVLRFVYPIEGNESIINVDYTELPDQLPLVLKARDTEDLVVAGPVDVLQGGQGILGRAPVFYEAEGERFFWGIVSSLISFDDMIAEITPLLREDRLEIAVRGIDGSGGMGSAFYGRDALFYEERSIQRNVSFPNGSWQIAVAPKDGWREHHPFHDLILVTIGVVVILATVYVNRQVVSSHQIKLNEKRLEDITYASSDIIWETDRSGVYTYISGKAESLLGLTQHELIGRSILALSDTQDGLSATKAMHAAMKATEPIVDLEVWIRGAGNRQICVLRNAIPRIEGRSGICIGYRGVDKDISLRRNLQNEVESNALLLELFFTQSLDGFFFMMLDEPVAWNDTIDKEKTLDYVFENQRITKINDAMLKQYRAAESDFMGLRPKDFFAHDIAAGRAKWRQLFDEERLHIDTDEQAFDGTPIVIEGDYIVIKDSQGRITGHFGVQRDVTNEREAGSQLQRYVTINDKHVITSQTDLDGIITYASTAFCSISGYTTEELIGQDHNIIRHPDMPDELFKELWETLEAGKTWHGEIKNLKKNGGYYWVDSDISPLVDRRGVCYGYMAVRQDITAKKELEIVSITDRLTGLFNRQKIDLALEEERTRYVRYGETYSIIILDIDHFKSVNDTFGHLEGDRVLKEISQIVRSQIRRTDIAGRWGGEEFLILCPHTDIAGATTNAEELRRSIETHDFGLSRPVTASIGVAEVSSSPDFGGESQVDSESEPTETVTNRLLRTADEALYQAKESGRNQVRRLQNPSE